MTCGLLAMISLMRGMLLLARLTSNINYTARLTARERPVCQPNSQISLILRLEKSLFARTTCAVTTVL